MVWRPRQSRESVFVWVAKEQRKNKLTTNFRPAEELLLLKNALDAEGELQGKWQADNPTSKKAQGKEEAGI